MTEKFFRARDTVLGVRMGRYKLFQTKNFFNNSISRVKPSVSATKYIITTTLSMDLVILNVKHIHEF